MSAHEAITPEGFYRKFRMLFESEHLCRGSEIYHSHERVILRKKGGRKLLHRSDDKEWTEVMSNFLSGLARTLKCYQEWEGSHRVDYVWHRENGPLTPIVLIEHEQQRYDQLDYVSKLFQSYPKVSSLAVVVTYAWERPKAKSWLAGDLVSKYQEKVRPLLQATDYSRRFLLIVGSEVDWSEEQQRKPYEWFGYSFSSPSGGLVGLDARSRVAARTP